METNTAAAIVYETYCMFCGNTAAAPACTRVIDQREITGHKFRPVHGTYAGDRAGSYAVRS